jgi:hypothetical protein
MDASADLRIGAQPGHGDRDRCRIWMCETVTKTWVEDFTLDLGKLGGKDGEPAAKYSNGLFGKA